MSENQDYKNGQLDAPDSQSTVDDNGVNGRRRGRRRRVGWVAAVLGLGITLGVLGSVAVNAVARSGHHGYHHRAVSVEDAQARLQHKAGWLLAAIDATPEQEEQILTRLSESVAELYPMREQLHAQKGELIALFSQPNFDPAGLEPLRQTHLDLAHEASSIIVGTLVDVAETLTPEQRQKLAAMAQRFKRHHRR